MLVELKERGKKGRKDGREEGRKEGRMEGKERKEEEWKDGRKVGYWMVIMLSNLQLKWMQIQNLQ